ncbi:phosphate transport system regulatory protein PhoU [Candidatus Izimaplasma bacterium ZiA1]|uniref:phosphate signaling complex protein PhoU n=1 Tax=Candidatus Izimoplasma sp. ZiA1 TaxID=2024899 RepID=UPI000BAA48C6|nr:phosphate transport system regulatory protein PhoU [Candidatus Izimaplasma bacterium ZiA1]
MVPSRSHFIKEMKDLNNKVERMGKEIEIIYGNLVLALRSNKKEIASNIVEEDKIINDIEVSINVDAYLLIAKQCPVASDLRRIITALKIANDLERIADYAVNISKYIIKSNVENKDFRDVLVSLAEKVINMFSNIMTAYRNEDIKLALEVCELDSQIDDFYKEKVKELIKIGKSNTDETAEAAIRALLVLKQLERAGDHITNIAENIVYLVNGKRLELN